MPAQVQTEIFLLRFPQTSDAPVCNQAELCFYDFETKIASHVKSTKNEISYFFWGPFQTEMHLVTKLVWVLIKKLWDYLGIVPKWRTQIIIFFKDGN